MALNRVSPETVLLPPVDGNTLSKINKSLDGSKGILNHDQLKEYYAAVIHMIENDKKLPTFYNYNIFNRYCSTACMSVCCIPCCMTKLLMIPLKCCCWKNRCVDCMDECSGECIGETCDRTWSTKKMDMSQMKTMPIEVICALVNKLIPVIKNPKNDKQLYNAMVILSNIYEKRYICMFMDVRKGRDPQIISKIMAHFANIPGFTEHWRMNYSNTVMI